jgi:hypothetical protein
MSRHFDSWKITTKGWIFQVMLRLAVAVLAVGVSESVTTTLKLDAPAAVNVPGNRTCGPISKLILKEESRLGAPSYRA